MSDPSLCLGPGLHCTVSTMEVTCHRLHAFTHPFGVRWLHLSCLPLNATSFYSCTGLQVAYTYQQNAFQPGSCVSIAAHQGIRSMGLLSADMALTAFSCFTQAERGLWTLTNSKWILWPAGPGQTALCG